MPRGEPYASFFRFSPPHSPHPFLGSCVPNNQRSTVHFDSVQRNRRLSPFILGPHLDERKSFRRPGSGIAYDLGVPDRPEWSERLLQGFRGDIGGQVADEELPCQGLTP